MRGLSHLVPPGGDHHGLQPLIGHSQVEGGQLSQLTGNPLYNLSVDPRYLVLNKKFRYSVMF